MICITEPRIPIVRRCEGYFLRWYYNGWHYWLFYPGKINFITEGEKYRTLGTQKLTIGSGQITQEQCDAIRTIMNSTEIYIYTDSGWGVVRIDPGSWIVYDHGLNRYEAEINVVIGSRNISSSGFSPSIVVPELPPSIYVPPCGEIVIGAQIWMACNYDVNFPGSKVYNNDESNRSKYGGLYLHSQVLTPGFCPYGWRVPTEDEWDDLIDAIGDLTDAGGILKQIGTTNWLAPNTGATDDYDFSALPGGFFFLGFNDVGETAYFWTTKTSSFIFVTGQALRMKNDSAGISKHQLAAGYYCSVRLIKDSPVISTDLITDVEATTVSDTEIDLTWVNHYVGATNNVIEYSTDGINYTLFDTVAAGDTSYSATGLNANTNYYWRLYFTVSGVYSLPSNVDSDWTAMRIPLESTGTGAGVSTLRLLTTSERTITIDGNGKFYSDAAGTLNESTSKQLTAGVMTTWYVKVSSGVCDILVFHKNDLTKWGEIAALAYGWHGSTNSPCVKSMNVSQLASSLTHIAIYGLNTITGTLIDLPRTLISIAFSGQNTISGDIADLPTGHTDFYCLGSNTVTGDIVNFNSGMSYIWVSGGNTLYGSLSDISNYDNIFVSGNNTISGNISDLQVGTEAFQITGNNTITGDIANIPNGVTIFVLDGDNTVYGDIADIPSTISWFRVYGDCEITDYTSPVVWGTVQAVMCNPAVGFGLSSAEVDNLLIDLSSATWSGGKYIVLKGSNATRTAASDAAVATLLGLGVMFDIY